MAKTLNQLVKEIASVCEAEFPLRARVRIKSPKPLPNGRTVQVVGLVDYLREDGKIEIRSCSAGVYDGARFTVSASEIEAA